MKGTVEGWWNKGMKEALELLKRTFALGQLGNCARVIARDADRPCNM